MSIQNTSSSVLEHGTAVTIYGSNFGVKDPAAPLIWDDFEDGIDPGWATVSGMQLNADNSRHTRSSRNAVGDFSRYRPLTFSKRDVGSMRLYACYWFKLGPNFVWYKGPVASTPLSNLKCFRIWN